MFRLVVVVVVVVVLVVADDVSLELHASKHCCILYLCTFSKIMDTILLASQFHIPPIAVRDDLHLYTR